MELCNSHGSLHLVSFTKYCVFKVLDICYSIYQDFILFYGSCRGSLESK